MLRIDIRGGFMLFGARDWDKQIKGITDGRLPGYDYAKLNQCLPVARVIPGKAPGQSGDAPAFGQRERRMRGITAEVSKLSEWGN